MAEGWIDLKSDTVLSSTADIQMLSIDSYGAPYMYVKDQNNFSLG